MIRSSFAAAAFTAVLAVSAFGIGFAKPAAAHPWHGGISVHLGHGAGLYYGGSCRRFYRRYLRTGNPYWLDRYEACRYGY